ncbi:hypothetical protein HPHPP25_0472 [Helicobacter pylori Hp P-25]|nr:hypothetical protein HPHPP25_0472 [Helicobacter pylori Hp P-25]
MIFSCIALSFYAKELKYKSSICSKKSSSFCFLLLTFAMKSL